MKHYVFPWNYTIKVYALVWELNKAKKKYTVKIHYRGGKMKVIDSCYKAYYKNDTLYIISDDEEIEINDIGSKEIRQHNYSHESFDPDEYCEADGTVYYIFGNDIKVDIFVDEVLPIYVPPKRKEVKVKKINAGTQVYRKKTTSSEKRPGFSKKLMRTPRAIRRFAFFK